MWIMINSIRDFDFYRKIPRDLTEGSSHGAALSLCAAIFMLILFIAEFWAFLSYSISSSVVLDRNVDHQIRINFNITGRCLLLATYLDTNFPFALCFMFPSFLLYHIVLNFFIYFSLSSSLLLSFRCPL